MSASASASPSAARLAAILIAVLAVLLATTRAEARVERFAVLIGNNAGEAREVELRYAERDAGKVHDVLKDLGGFPPANLTLLRGEDAETVRSTLIALNDRIRAAMSSPGVEAVLFVYYSGHADAGALHLGATRLDIAQLEQLVRGSPATFRVLVLDACRSGALTRVKGGTPAPPFAIKLDARLSAQGVVLLTSSSANEDAQESDEIHGSFFTHALVSGLLGAADADLNGSVTLDEAYRHAYDATLRATSRTLAGAQHPTFRYDLRGEGRLVLTTLPAHASRRGHVEFPEGRMYLLLQGGSQGPVVAEVGAHDKARRISVKPGKYFVRGRGADFLLEGEVMLAAGDEVVASDDRFTRVAYARLVRKGYGNAGAAHGPQAGYRFRTPLANGSALCHGAFFGYAFELEHLSVVPRVGACHSTFANARLTADSDEVDVEVRLSHAWDAPWLTLELGIAAGGAVLRQAFETRGVAPGRVSAAGMLAVSAGALFDLPGGFYGLVDAEAQTYVFKQRDGGGQGVLAPSFAVRPAFGVGKRW